MSLFKQLLNPGNLEHNQKQTVQMRMSNAESIQCQESKNNMNKKNSDHVWQKVVGKLNLFWKNWCIMKSRLVKQLHFLQSIGILYHLSAGILFQLPTRTQENSTRATLNNTNAIHGVLKLIPCSLHRNEYIQLRLRLCQRYITRKFEPRQALPAETVVSSIRSNPNGKQKHWKRKNSKYRR